jgi:hypothetical protein
LPPLAALLKLRPFRPAALPIIAAVAAAATSDQLAVSRR